MSALLPTTPPRIILGTMTFAGQTNQTDATTMIDSFIASPLSGAVAELDTARMYGGGKTEDLLGEIFVANPTFVAHTSIASKANPFKAFNAAWNLSSVGTHDQLSASLSSLQSTALDIFYLHAPDPDVNIEETLHTVQQMFEANKFKRFALSNFTAWETTWIVNFMTQKGWVVPTIYQGMMNAVTRKTTEELIPCLRRLGMAFYAYNPLAGGMLTGKFTKGAATGEGRFNANTPWGKIYQGRFMQDKQFEAMELVRQACADCGDVPLPEAALRWMMHHSGLEGDRGDGIIIGASTIGHFEANMEALTQGPLPAEILAAYDQGWELCRGVCPSFARGVSGSAVV